ncbi:MAG: phosphodiester glycosidase family protein [Gemmatimonadetes bacterium]|nr:phosphodiester glycosidase family protein [Gemmatimonadota bacterium]
MPIACRLAPVLLAAAVASAAAQGPAPARTDTLAPGVVHTRLDISTGPWTVHVLRVDLGRGDIALRHERAHGQLATRERVSAMAARVAQGGDRVLAAVNADFFDLASGASENNVVIGAEWWKGVRVTESPYDTFDNVHAQFALDSRRRPLLDRFAFDGWARTPGASFPLIALNAMPRGTYEGTALWTPRVGPATPRDSVRPTTELALFPAGHRDDTVLFVRRSASKGGGLAIPADGAVLSAYGARAAALDSTADGDTVRITLAAAPRLAAAAGRLSLVVGGWPRILRGGVNVAALAPSAEGTISRNAEVRHPRTGVGFSRDSTTLLLVTVDGRGATSVGMTLVELADLMKSLGAWNALNFDGGGSATMVIDGKVVNTPSDRTGEREVGSALLVVQRTRPD